MTYTAVGSWPESRWAPPAFGLLTVLLVAVTWGSLRPWPVLHDEWAYWTQAQQYAALRWSAPSPAIPEFFEQLYVLVTPVFAAKYWPGHAMAIGAGFALGMPALIPLVLSGVAGALVFALARRMAGARVAALTFVLWVSTFGNLRFRASFFSELTTSSAWLIAWWALLRWRETKQSRWMVALAVATGWGAITRPATMFVFAIPVGAVVVADCVRGKRWRHLALGVGCGIALLGILPLWSAQTTGDWRTTPMALYTRQYLPFDVPGYTVRDTLPERAVPVEMERVREFLREIKTEQATAPALRTFAERMGFLLRDAFAGWRAPFVFAFAVGLTVAGATGWFAIASALLLVLGYVTQAHTRDWTIYYLEVFPALAFITALGTRRLAREVRARIRAGGAGAARPAGWRAAVGAVGGVVAFAVYSDTIAARDTLARVSARTGAFRAGVATLQRKPNIVFVRYAERRNMHLSFVANDGDLEQAASWIVHDRGADNARLIAAAPKRTAYLYDEATSTFREIVP